MKNIGHTAERMAVGTAIDLVLKKINKDEREEELVKMAEFMRKYVNVLPEKINYDRIKELIMDKEGFINQYVNRVLDEVDPKVLKTMALNFGFEILFLPMNYLECIFKFPGSWGFSRHLF